MWPHAPHRPAPCLRLQAYYMTSAVADWVLWPLLLGTASAAAAVSTLPCSAVLAAPVHPGELLAARLPLPPPPPPSACLRRT